MVVLVLLVALISADRVPSAAEAGGKDPRNQALASFEKLVGKLRDELRIEERVAKRPARLRRERGVPTDFSYDVHRTDSRVSPFLGVITFKQKWEQNVTCPERLKEFAKHPGVVKPCGDRAPRTEEEARSAPFNWVDTYFFTATFAWQGGKWVFKSAGAESRQSQDLEPERLADGACKLTDTQAGVEKGESLSVFDLTCVRLAAAGG